MVSATLADLWAQFAALASTILLVYGLSKVPPVRALFRRNIADPFAGWLAHLLEPVRAEIADVRADMSGVHERLYEVAEFLDYQFKANGGNSLRDRVDIAANASEELLRGHPNDSSSHHPGHAGQAGSAD